MEGKQELYKAVLGRKWEEVAEVYKRHPEIQAMKIAESEETALHVAIGLGASEDMVVKLVDEIEKTDQQVGAQTLAAQNNHHDTPLHYAASRGSPSICKRILQVHETLVFYPNKQGETPLFFAALNGHKHTFLFLHSVCSKMEYTTSTGLSPWRRTNGDTILHCTIRREYFDLALRIIHLYDDRKIASVKNKDGVTPLRALARTPSAFKSGTSMSLWHKLCYNYIGVDKLKIDTQVEGHVLDLGNSDLLKADAPLRSQRARTQGSARMIKEKHVWGAQLMEELLERTFEYNYTENQSRHEQTQQGNPSEEENRTALLKAAKYGLIELVKRILDVFPVSIYEKTNRQKRNIVHVAVRKRQTHVLKLLMDHPLWYSLSEAVDAEGNNVLHLASFRLRHMPRQIHSFVMQMQYEALWFKYVKENMPVYMRYQENDHRDTPDQIFANEHRELLKESNEWLKDTSGSYAIVAALIVSVTYATSYSVPGGTDDSGKPHLRGHPAFNVFVFSILISFCSSITSLAAFVAVFSSRKQPVDYLRSFPFKLCFGLTTFYLSLVSMLVSFCAAHFFELDQRIKHKISPYGLMLIPLGLYTYEQIPLCWNLLRTIFVNEPQP